MRSRLRARRKAVGLTSLIDVIFLLLLFFMLASSFTKYQLVPVAGGASGGGAKIRPALLRIHAADSMDLNGLPLAKDEMAERLRSLGEDEARTVAVWSGPAASVQDVIDVIVEARAVGLDTVLLTDRN
ncbi:ExbD/TolR family protein [Polymorphum gilvum]|uniref:Biopolymer transporter ExbD n=1 Tax=Polymorphum gilvum (strain LMG 25793 / CGMCC 1.9160 / SL003B-26A1) TaxID=991905 RepID=F2IYX9_POLGS|nr:biopolymer transporter ExbD [Polymorphum gilvum]ADZ70594.1 hypothetical protein SL003B_2169 [Polymorphum gilvum SL003B-26A1]